VDSQGEREQLLRKGYEAGVWYEKTYHGCSQCVLAAIMDVMDGGLACNSRATCGALTGRIGVLSDCES